jgi:hypothetical protein
MGFDLVSEPHTSKERDVWGTEFSQYLGNLPV